MSNSSPADPRAVLASLAADRREDFSALSRLIGRNPSYIQQFVRRGVPRKLDGDDRRTLARYFGVDEQILGGEEQVTRAVVPAARAGPASGDDLVLVPRLAVEASAGSGAVADEERADGRIAFAAGYLRQVTGGAVGCASILAVRGDSMVPTLADGDDILVVAAAPGAPVRDGIHVLRAEGVLLVKRLMVQPMGGLRVQSDNRDYPTWTCAASEVDVIGRVVWAGRRLG